MAKVRVETDAGEVHEFDAPGVVLVALDEDHEAGRLFNELWQSRANPSDLIRSIRVCAKALTESGNALLAPIGDMTNHNLDNFMEGLRQVKDRVREN